MYNLAELTGGADVAAMAHSLSLSLSLSLTINQSIKQPHSPAQSALFLQPRPPLPTVPYTSLPSPSLHKPRNPQTSPPLRSRLNLSHSSIAHQYRFNNSSECLQSADSKDGRWPCLSLSSHILSASRTQFGACVGQCITHTVPRVSRAIMCACACACACAYACASAFLV